MTPFSIFRLTKGEEAIISFHGLVPPPEEFVDDVRVAVRKNGVAATFEKELTSFKKKFGRSLCVGHVVVCSDRACEAAGLPKIRVF